jgi:thiol-disulfide isomerase/thioredoxin
MRFTKKRVAITIAITLCAASSFLLYSRVRGITTGERYEDFSSTASAALPELSASITQANLRTLDGKSLQLSSHAGKVVVIDLWATWCGPCRKEIPQLVELNKEYKNRGVEVIGLTIEDPRLAAQNVSDFAKEFHIDYTLGFAGDVAAALMQGTNNIPQKFVITRDGRLMKRLIGFNSQTGPSELRAAIEKALNIGSDGASVVQTQPAAIPSDGVRRITPQELHDSIAKGEAVVIDVRPDAQYRAAHIQGTLWIPENEIKNSLKELPRGKLIVTYCA